MVVRKTKGKSYILEDSNGVIFAKSFPISHLKAFNQENDDNTQPSYVVEKILGHRGPKNNREYQVKWYGYDDSHNTWESFDMFNDQKQISDYWKSLTSSRDFKQVGENVNNYT